VARVDGCVAAVPAEAELVPGAGWSRAHTMQ
jgi:hypothetical protein